MTVTLPALLPVRNMLEDLLGREVTISPADPVEAGVVRTMLLALYTDNAGRLAAVLGMDLPLAAYAGAALGLLPAGGAEDSIEEKRLAPMLAENVHELCNVLTGLLNREGAPRVTLHRVIAPGDEVPNDAVAHLLALGRRLDLHVDIARYGGGKLSLALAD